MENIYLLVRGADYEGASPVKAFANKAEALFALEEACPDDRFTPYDKCGEDPWHENCVAGRKMTGRRQTGDGDYQEVLEVPFVH